MTYLRIGAISQSRHYETSECEGKRGYASFNDAQNGMRRPKRATHYRVVPYKCSFCGAWHVGGSIKHA